MEVKSLYLEAKDYRDCDDLESRWKLLSRIRHGLGLKEENEFLQQHGNSAHLAKVGRELYEYFTTVRGREEELNEICNNSLSKFQIFSSH